MALTIETVFMYLKDTWVFLVGLLVVFSIYFFKFFQLILISFALILLLIHSRYSLYIHYSQKQPNER